MADIVCIKIGENESSLYSKYNQLSKSFDIIDVLPRKRDEKGCLINYGIGIKAEKRYFQLSVNMSHLSDEKFISFRDFLCMPSLEDKRRFNINLNNYSVIEKDTKDALLSQATKCVSSLKSTMDVSSITRLDKEVLFNDFIKMVVDKTTGKTLDTFLPKEYAEKS